MHYLGEFIATFANVWDAADATECRKDYIMSCCSKNPVFLENVRASSEFLNSDHVFVFQYMPDELDKIDVAGVAEVHDDLPFVFQKFERSFR